MNNTDIQSYNSKNIGARSRHYLFPGTTQLIFYFLISFVALAALNGQEIWHYFNDTILSVQAGSDPAISANNSFQPQIFNAISRSRVPQIIFWGAVGCGAYIVVWLAGIIFTNLRNDIVADEFVHPAGYSHAKYWESVVARKTFFGLTLLLLLTYIYALARLFPQLAGICRRTASDFSVSTSLPKLAGSLLAAIVLTHILIILLRLMINSWQTIFHDL